MLLIIVNTDILKNRSLTKIEYTFSQDSTWCTTELEFEINIQLTVKQTKKGIFIFWLVCSKLQFQWFYLGKTSQK